MRRDERGRIMRTRAMVALLALGAVSLASCGGDDSSSSSDAGEDTTAETVGEDGATGSSDDEEDSQADMGTDAADPATTTTIDPGPVEAAGAFLVQVTVADETSVPLAAAYLDSVLAPLGRVSPVQIQGTRLTALVSNVPAAAVAGFELSEPAPPTLRPVLADVAEPVLDPDVFSTPTGARVRLGDAPSDLGTSFVSRAEATPTDGGWSVIVELDAAGTAALSVLSTSCLDRQPDCPTGRLALVANGGVVLDAVVRAVIDSGEILISGGLDEQRSELIAAALGGESVRFDSVSTSHIPPTFTGGRSGFGSPEPIDFLTEAIGDVAWLPEGSFVGQPAEWGDVGVAAVHDADGSFIAFYSFTYDPSADWQIETVVGDANEACASLDRSPQASHLLPSFAEKTGCVPLDESTGDVTEPVPGPNHAGDLVGLRNQSALGSYCQSPDFGDLMDQIVASSTDEATQDTSVDEPGGPNYPCRYRAAFGDMTVLVRLGVYDPSLYETDFDTTRDNLLATFARMGTSVVTDEGVDDRWLATGDSDDPLVADQTQVGIRLGDDMVSIVVEVSGNGDRYLVAEAVARAVESALPEIASGLS